MPCFIPKNKLSVPNNKSWKGFISTFQKKWNKLLKPKPFNRIITTQYYHHHHHHHYRYYSHYYHHHHHHHQHQPAQSNSADNDHQDGLEDDHGDSDHNGQDAKNEESSCLQLDGVDASAEEFIDKMKRKWKLERQISEENCIQTWVRIYEH